MKTTINVTKVLRFHRVAKRDHDKGLQSLIENEVRFIKSLWVDNYAYLRLNRMVHYD